jgi:hypothetical protein
MRLGFISLKFSLFSAVFILFMILFVSPVSAQFPVLMVYPMDTVTEGYGDVNDLLKIYMANYEDTVAAFTLVLTSSHPDVIHFQPESYDQYGTLTEDWEYITATGNEVSVKISAMANTYLPPYTPGIGHPQMGEVPLIKLLYDTGDRPDTMTTPFVHIYISKDLHDFNFSDELGNSIGLGYDDPTYDTLWYNCTEWNGDECLTWEEVTGPPADTMVIDTVLHPYLDTNLVRIYDCTIYLKECWVIGDANGDRIVNIFDITRIISYLYLGGGDFPTGATPDANCDCIVNIFDLTCLLNQLYLAGMFCEPCSCEQWESNCGK